MREQLGAIDGDGRDDRAGDKAGELAARPDLGDDGGAWGAGVDRKGSEQPGERAAGANPDEVALDIRRLARSAGKGARGPAVCTMTMTEMIAARPITCVRSSSEGVGMARCGGANSKAPTTATPRASK